MTTCKRWGKSGFLLRLSLHGLCADYERKIEGSIGYYHLEEWWETAFSEDERVYIEGRLKESGVSLTRGRISSSSQSTVDFLNGLITWFKAKSDAPIAEEIRKKLNKVAGAKPVRKPEYYRGRHYSSYPSDIEELIRQGKLAEAETLLYHCVDATEAEGKAQGCGVAPWFYDKLAMLYRKQKDLKKEYLILERYANQKHAPGVKPAKLMERFDNVKELLTEKS